MTWSGTPFQQEVIERLERIETMVQDLHDNRPADITLAVDPEVAARLHSAIRRDVDATFEKYGVER